MLLGPFLHQGVSDGVSPGRVARTDDDLVPGQGQADRQSTTGGAGTSQNSNAHHPTLAHTTIPAERTVDGNLTGSWDSSRENGFWSPACSPTPRWPSQWPASPSAKAPRPCCGGRGGAFCFPSAPPGTSPTKPRCSRST